MKILSKSTIFYYYTNYSKSVKVGLDNSLTEERLMKIIQLYGFEKDALTKKFSYENFVFEVQTPQSKYMIRIAHSEYNSIHHIRAELDWIAYLGTHGIKVVTPVASITGNVVEEVDFGDFSFIVVVFDYITGQNFTENKDLLTDESIQQWGALVAKLHNLSKEYEPESSARRKEWDEEPLFKNIDDALSEFPGILREAKDIIEEVRQLPTESQVYGLIHQDLHESNLILDGEEMTIIDFDDCHYSWYIEDIAIILFHIAWRFQSEYKSRQDIVEEFFPLFMKGYNSVNRLDEFWTSKIPLFVKLRHFRLFCTLAYELEIEEDEWSRNLLDYWKPMLQNNDDWIDLSTLL